MENVPWIQMKSHDMIRFPVCKNLPADGTTEIRGLALLAGRVHQTKQKDQGMMQWAG